MSEEAKTDLYDLLFSHKFHPVTVEMWKEDFKNGVLFPCDFLYPNEPYPDAYILHAFDIYAEVCGQEALDRWIRACLTDQS